MSSTMPAGTVCIVDDEPGVRQLLQTMCESADLPTKTYSSAEALIATCDSSLSSCAMILLDIDLPGMNGLELLSLLRRDGFSGPVVVISGGQDESLQTEARNLGAADFFDKPFDIRAVRQRICELLAQHSRHHAQHPAA